MCHHIEDPTFDATASATNPRARMRPVHRPPRMPAGPPPALQLDRRDRPRRPNRSPSPRGRAGSRPRRPPPSSSSPPCTRPIRGGYTDYDRRDGSGSAASTRSHNRRSCGSSTSSRCRDISCRAHTCAQWSSASVRMSALRLGAHQATGIAGLAAKRLARVLGTTGGAHDVARVLDLHPAFHPRAYVDLRVEPGDEPTLTLRPCSALDEGDELTWPALLARGETGPLEAAVRAVDPRNSVRRIDAEPGRGRDMDGELRSRRRPGRRSERGARGLVQHGRRIQVRLAQGLRKSLIRSLLREPNP